MKYTIYHNTFTSAITEAKNTIESHGYKMDGDSFFDEISTGIGRPSTGHTNKFHVKLLKNDIAIKQYLHIQVYNTGHSYELNMYIL